MCGIADEQKMEEDGSIFFAVRTRPRSRARLLPDPERPVGEMIEIAATGFLRRGWALAHCQPAVSVVRGESSTVCLLRSVLSSFMYCRRVVALFSLSFGTVYTCSCALAS